MGDSGVTSSGNVFSSSCNSLIKPVVFEVGEVGLAEDVIGVIVPPDFIGELGVAGLGFIQRHVGSVPSSRRRWKINLALRSAFVPGVEQSKTFPAGFMCD